MEKEIKEDKMLEFRYVIKDETGLHARPPECWPSWCGMRIAP